MTEQGLMIASDWNNFDLTNLESITVSSDAFALSALTSAYGRKGSRI
jgi:hypothetical protein